jgi:hypothetical protein
MERLGVAYYSWLGFPGIIIQVIFEGDRSVQPTTPNPDPALSLSPHYIHFHHYCCMLQVSIYE